MDQNNNHIHCTVDSCVHHSAQDACSLNQIRVGCCEGNPTSCKGTECDSFQLK